MWSGEQTPVSDAVQI